ncbi:MAG: CopG family transcriptional regulator [bacterium]|nr:CopG family transcriptional regulator [bacterium]
MKQKIKYTDEPLGNLRVVKDFLPAPAQLALSEDTVKVTIALSKASVVFFKKAAAKHGSPYQRMIRNLLDYYTAHHPGPN